MLSGGFFDRTPLPRGKAKRWWCGSKNLPGRLLLLSSLDRFPFEGLGLQFYFRTTVCPGSEGYPQRRSAATSAVTVNILPSVE